MVIGTRRKTVGAKTKSAYLCSINQNFKKMKNKFSLSIGIMLILFASVALLSALGIIPEEISRIIISWQMLVFVIGLQFILFGANYGGLITTIIGVYLLLPRIYSVYGIEMPIEKQTLTTVFIASLIIALGVYIIFKGSRYISKKKHFFEKKKHFFDIKPRKNGTSEINCAFGEVNHAIIEKPFKGAAVSNAFGAIHLNMVKTTLPDGDSFLEVNNAFGGTIITVPESWTVINSVQAFFGGLHDKRDIKPNDNASRLIIRGSIAFGGIEIKSIPDENYTETDDYGDEAEIDSISVKHNNRIHIVSLDELQYIQSDGDYVTLCTTQGKFLKEQTMKYFQNALPAEKFVRIHRSYIVNISEISSIDCRGKEVYYVILKNGTALRTSNSGYQALKEKLEL